jgi:hypothetical protein
MVPGKAMSRAGGMASIRATGSARVKFAGCEPAALPARRRAMKAGAIRMGDSLGSGAASDAVSSAPRPAFFPSPVDADRFHAVVAAFDRVRRLYGFKRVEVPVIEPTAVFARTIGETTDVVSKEMYSSRTAAATSITLRPEFTAGICRAYLSEGWQQHSRR